MGETEAGLRIWLRCRPEPLPAHSYAARPDAVEKRLGQAGSGPGPYVARPGRLMPPREARWVIEVEAVRTDIGGVRNPFEPEGCGAIRPS